MTCYEIIRSPLGDLVIIADGRSLIGLIFIDNKKKKVIFNGWQKNNNQLILLQAKKQLGLYFSGNLNKFEIPIALKGSDFQKLVWNELAKIPYGETITYKQLAVRIGRPQSARAVGNAVSKNPIPIIIPCHRVVSSNGLLGGYVAGQDIKRYLLVREDNNRFS